MRRLRHCVAHPLIGRYTYILNLERVLIMEHKSVYKFFPYNPHDLDALSNEYLWFSKYSDFNDPFEDIYLKNVLNKELTSYDQEKAIAFYKELHKDQLPAHEVEKVILEFVVSGKLEDHYRDTMTQTFAYAQNLIRRHLEESRVCCFAQNSSTERAIENKLMWSHYADGLRGFCIKYNEQKLIDGIYKKMGTKVGICQMQYRELSKLNFDELIFSTASQANKSEEHDVIQFGEIVNTKSKDWAYENEFRLIFPKENSVSIDSSSIEEVIIGGKMPEVKVNTLFSILKGNKNISCPIYKADICSDTFKIKKELVMKSI